VAQLSTLGGYTLMKNIHVIAFLLLVLCGCSKRHEIPARNLVVAGKDITWSGSENENYVLHVNKRNGDFLEGIHVIYTGHPGGPPATITADKGTIMPTSDHPISSHGVTYTNIVMIVLQNAQFQTDKENQSIEEFTLYIRP